jgi:CBS domain-containing protein
MDGTRARRRLAGVVAHHDVPTCRLADSPSAVRARLGDHPSATCIVVNDAGVVLGRLRRAAWRSKDPATSVEEVMDVPTTYRPDNLVESLVDAGAKADAELVITTSDGVLVGVIRPQEVRRRLAKSRRTRTRRAKARSGRRTRSARSRTRSTTKTRP